jgi:O-antigen/teichoic acid export membrane protein
MLVRIQTVGAAVGAIVLFFVLGFTGQHPDVAIAVITTCAYLLVMGGSCVLIYRTRKAQAMKLAQSETANPTSLS